MLIDLKNTPSFWLTCAKSIDRHPEMNELIKTIGCPYGILDGEITTPYTIGVAKNHLDAITNSYYSQSNTLVFEDDARLVNKFNQFLSIPDDADALYLGTSLYGRFRKPDGVFHTVSYGTLSIDYNSTLLRILNMLSLHAVLYIGGEYKLHCMSILQKFIQNPSGGMDDPIAESMHKFNIYALKEPMFYQKDGHSEFATTARVNPIL